MENFIQTSIKIKRTLPKPIKDERMGNVILRMKEEKLKITIEYVGHGDTTKITDEQLLDKIQNLLEKI